MVPRLTRGQIRVLHTILRYLDEVGTTPSTQALAKEVYGSRSSAGSVHYHITGLRKKGLLAPADELNGRIAVPDKDEAAEAVEVSLAIFKDALDGLDG